MGVGVVVTVGVAICGGITGNGGLRRGSLSSFGKWLPSAAALVLCIGLLKSYSRGAWLAVGVGGLYLLILWWKRCHIESAKLFRWMRIGAGVAIVPCAVLTLLLWHYQNTGNVTAHRAISASNRNDLSWRNRIAAWEGALQIMAGHPWFGAGWNQAEPLYEHYYLPPKLTESAAIEMNDYLMLGDTLGIPALFCFCMYLWLSFTFRPSELPLQPLAFSLQPSELDWLKTVCRAGALVLAVGFWFDGGLFKLPTAATFWILLELGREEAQKAQK
jgi:O-antigen ligase